VIRFMSGSSSAFMLNTCYWSRISSATRSESFKHDLPARPLAAGLSIAIDLDYLVILVPEAVVAADPAAAEQPQEDNDH
jgi:hypothetical protein